MKKKNPRILVSAAMRSGSTLVSNILNAHKDILIVENFHFQRFIYQDGKKLTKNLLKYKVYEMRDRLQLRYNYINTGKCCSFIKLEYKPNNIHM